jgi:hypothetical protein
MNTTTNERLWVKAVTRDGRTNEVIEYGGLDQARALAKRLLAAPIITEVRISKVEGGELVETVTR